MQIEIKQATAADIPAFEQILLEAVEWMDSTEKSMWKKENITWEYQHEVYGFNQEDIYIAYIDGETAGCAIIMDYDPSFWPNIEKGQSLFVHRLAVRRFASGKGVSVALLNYAKEMAAQQNIPAVRLDCSKLRPKLRSLYESQGFKCVDERLMFEHYECAFYEWNC